MKGIMSGLEPVKMEKGGESKLEQIDQFIKDWILNYEDPSELATLPLYLAGPLGAGAARGIKGLRMAAKVAKNAQPSGIEKALTSKMVSQGLPVGALSYDITSVLSEMDDMEEPEEMRDGGVVHAKVGKLIEKALTLGKKSKKKPAPKKKKETPSESGKLDSTLKSAIVGTGKTIKKNPIVSGIVAGPLAYKGYQSLVAEPEKEEKPEYVIDESGALGDGSGIGGGQTDQDFLLKDIIRGRAQDIASQAGRPNVGFMDYLKALPGGYMEKVGKDPDFARQMMAGFLAMMKPTEGFVPRSGVVDFGEAAMAEAQRQEEAVPAAIRTLEYLAQPGNEELLSLYLAGKSSAGETTLDLMEKFRGQNLKGQIVAMIDPSIDATQAILRDPQGNLVTELTLLDKASKLSPSDLQSYISTLSIE